LSRLKREAKKVSGIASKENGMIFIKVEVQSGLRVFFGVMKQAKVCCIFKRLFWKA